MKILRNLVAIPLLLLSILVAGVSLALTALAEWLIDE